MGKREQRIRKNPINISLVEFEALIKEYGYIKEGGSHPKAKIGKTTFPYKRENPVKPRLCERVDKNNRYNEINECGGCYERE